MQQNDPSGTEVSRVRRWARSAGVILALVIGGSGIGAFVGYLWLVEATRSVVHRSEPFSVTNARSGHTTKGQVPETMEDLSDAIFSAPIRDFGGAARALFQQLAAPEHDRLMVTVRTAAADGDPIARRVVDALAWGACRDLALLSGIPLEAGETANCCPAAITYALPTRLGADVAARTDIVHLAQLAAIIEAGVATLSARERFCVVAEAAPRLPPAFEARILTLVTASCVPTIPGLGVDGGTSDGDGGGESE